LKSRGTYANKRHFSQFLLVVQRGTYKNYQNLSAEFMGKIELCRHIAKKSSNAKENGAAVNIAAKRALAEKSYVTAGVIKKNWNIYAIINGKS